MKTHFYAKKAVPMDDERISQKKKPYEMSKAELRNKLCEVGVAGGCSDCLICEFGKEWMNQYGGEKPRIRSA